MDFVKGFMVIESYENNTPGAIAPLGELSTWCRTYAKDKREYVSETDGFKFICFSSINTDNGETVTVNPNYVTDAIKIVQKAAAYAASHIRPYNPDDFKNHLVTEFYQSISNIEIGRLIDNGIIALPEWISFVNKQTNGVVKFWLADESFADQYDEWKIEVIPPVDNVDIFFSPFGTVVDELNKRTTSDLGNLIEEAKGRFPETYLKFMPYRFYNVHNKAQFVDTNWSVIIYGKAGNDIDVIKDAIVEYVLSHSTHTREQWEAIFPDLFKRTEFVILPLWHKIAIEDLQVASGLYRSMVNPVECIELAKSVVDYYPSDFVEDNTTVFAFDYKAITLVSVNGYANADHAKSIIDVFPDYLPINSALTDFNRMKIKTRDWIVLLERMLIEAERADQFSTMPMSMRKKVRNGKLYISALYQNINFLVAVKSNDFYKD